MSEPIAVGVIGAAGRMGSLVARGLQADGGFLVAALYDLAGGELAGVGTIATSLESFLRAPTTHVVDFSLGPAVDGHGASVLRAGKHYLVGATGATAETLRHLEAAACEAGVSCLVVPNFSLGANLMMKFSQRAARFFPAAEIVERHHTGKKDAPSGTALATAKLIAAAGNLAPPPGEERLAGCRGADEQGVRIHSQRLPGVLAEQAVVFGGEGETLTIEHRSLSRECFLPGVKLALRALGSFTGLRVGLASLLKELP